MYIITVTQTTALNILACQKEIKGDRPEVKSYISPLFKNLRSFIGCLKNQQQFPTLSESSALKTGTQLIKQILTYGGSQIE